MTTTDAPTTARSPETAGPVADVRPAGRDPWLDNARAVLIALVVVGHLIETMGGRAADTLYTWIYSFHMPAFVLVSGYLSRSFTAGSRQSKALVATLVVPYVVFRTIHEAERWAVTGHFSTNLFVPSFALWFLLALFCWRLATPVLRVLRYPFAFAVVISLAVPFDESVGTAFTLGRIFGFLPFFALGLVLRPEHLDVLRTRAARVVGAAVLGGMLVVAGVVAADVPRGALYLRGPYADLHLHGLAGPAARLTVCAVGIVGAAAVLGVTSSRTRWWTQVGRNSLTVYLLQAALIFPLKVHGDLEALTGWAATAVVVILGVLLTVVLGSDPVERWTRWLVRPPVGWLVRRTEPVDVSGSARA